MDLQRRSLLMLLLLLVAVAVGAINDAVVDGAPESARLSLAAEVRVLQVAEKVAPSPFQQESGAVESVVKKRESFDAVQDEIRAMEASARMAESELNAEEQAEAPPMEGYEFYEYATVSAPAEEDVFSLRDKGLSKKEAALLRPADDDKAAHRWKGIRSTKHAFNHKQALSDAIRVRKPPRGPPMITRYPSYRSATPPSAPAPPPPPPTLPSGFRPMLPPPGFQARPHTVPAEIMQDVNAAYSHVSFRTRPARPQVAVPSRYQPQVSLQVQSATLQVEGVDENTEATHMNEEGRTESPIDIITEKPQTKSQNPSQFDDDKDDDSESQTLQELEEAIKKSEEDARIRARAHAELKAKAKAAAQSKIRQENEVKQRKAHEARAKAKAQAKNKLQAENASTTARPPTEKKTKSFTTQVETQTKAPDDKAKEIIKAHHNNQTAEKGRRGKVLEAEINSAPDGSQPNKRELEYLGRLQSTSNGNGVKEVNVYTQEQEQAAGEHVEGYAVEVPKPVHYAVEVDVPRPVHVPVERPVPVPVEKEVPVPVRVPVERPVPVPVPVERQVPYPVAVPVPHPVPVPVRVPRPVPHYVEVHIPVRKPVPVAVHVPVRRPYPVKLRVPFAVPIDKPYPVHVKVPVERPYPVYVHKPFPVHFQKHVPYTVEKHVPFEVKVPVDKPYPLHIPQPYPVHYSVERPYHVHMEKNYPLRMSEPVERPYESDEHHITLESAFDPRYAHHHHHHLQQQSSAEELVPNESQENAQISAPSARHGEVQVTSPVTKTLVTAEASTTFPETSIEESSMQ